MRILLSYNFTSKTWEELMTQDADIQSLFSNSFKRVYHKINAWKSMQFLQSFHQNTYQFEAATDRHCLSFFSRQQSPHQRKNHLDVSSALEKLNWKVLKTKKKTKNKVNVLLLLLMYIWQPIWQTALTFTLTEHQTTKSKMRSSSQLSSKNAIQLY